ncbi:MAG: thrombospondin type 3 repeat-containing protein, partial [Pseudomonadota bacterium]
AHVGFDGWSTVLSPDPAMNAGDDGWTLVIDVPAQATSVQLAFNDGTGTWDNNGGQDWSFAVDGAVAPPWLMDGQLDDAAQLVAQNGAMHLWAAVANGQLYLATDAATNGEDAFVLLADTPGAMGPAMWAKAGQVAGWSAFMADESDNGFAGWFDAQGASQLASGDVLEGTIDLTGEFNNVPHRVYVAVARYATPDGGALNASNQVPPSEDSNGDLEAAEYVELVLATLGATDTDADGVADDVDNCTTSPNADQRDTDADGYGNVCDADFNNDCVVNVLDLGVMRLNFFGGNSDTDLNGDGVVNVTDLGLLRSLFFAPPGPSGVAVSCSAGG